MLSKKNYLLSDTVTRTNVYRDDEDEEYESWDDNKKCERDEASGLDPYYMNHRRKPKSLYFIYSFIFFVLMYFFIAFYGGSSNEIPKIAGWNTNTSRDVSDYILPNENTTLIEPTNVCDNEKIFLLIVVCSSADNFDSRQSIRETWGNVSEFNYPFFTKFHTASDNKYLDIVKNPEWDEYVFWTNDTNGTNTTTSLSSKNSSRYFNRNFVIKILFLLGQPQNDDKLQYRINYENDVNGDIIQENFVDSYNNLTLKSIMMLKWITNNCNDKVKYLMKCDDDSFINIPNLIHVLMGGTIPVYTSTITLYDSRTIDVRSKKNRLNADRNLLTGFLFCEVRPIADAKNKWYSPNYMYSGDFYPNYLSGTAYLMSVEVAKLLYNASIKIPLFHLEDVYITGICPNAIKLPRRHHPLFSFTYTKDLCALRGMITQHHISASDMKSAYDFITNTSIVCAIPKKNFTTKLKLQQRKKCH